MQAKHVRCRDDDNIIIVGFVFGFWFSAGSGGIEKMTSRINVNFSASKLIIT